MNHPVPAPSGRRAPSPRRTVVALALLGAAVAGCATGTENHASPAAPLTMSATASPDGSTPTSTPASRPPATTATATATTGGAAVPKPPTAPKPDNAKPDDKPAAGGPARCTSPVLSVEMGGGGASLGHAPNLVVFTNTGSEPCTLQGYPGVSYLGADGTAAGLPADRVPATPPLVTLAPGTRAHASMSVSHAVLESPGCGPTVDGVTLHVLPPEEWTPKVVPAQATLCSASVMLHIGVVHPGTEPVPGENAGA